MKGVVPSVLKSLLPPCPPLLPPGINRPRGGPLVNSVTIRAYCRGISAIKTLNISLPAVSTTAIAIRTPPTRDG